MLDNPETQSVGGLTIGARGDRELVATRWFDASPDLLFACWTQPNLIRQWLLGPDGWNMPECEVDLRVGGAYAYSWSHGDGRSMRMSGRFLEIDAPSRMVSTQLFDDDWTGGEVTVTVEMLPERGGTLIRETSVYASAEARAGALATGMASGMETSFQRIEAITQPETSQVRIENGTDVIVWRMFDAPPKTVFAAHTQPALVRRWLNGPDGWTMTGCDIDLKVGRTYRYAWEKDAGEGGFAFVGTFHEIEPPHRLVHSESMEGMAGESLVTSTFEARGDKTLLTVRMHFDSPETCQAAVSTGMTDGMETSYARLNASFVTV